MPSKSALVAVPSATSATSEAAPVVDAGYASPGPGSGPRPRRIRIPSLCDLVLIDDHEQFALLNADAGVSREIPTTGLLLHRLIGSRIAGTLAVGSQPLPVFVDRSDVARATTQQRLERQLESAKSDWSPHIREIDLLARYVAGAGTHDDAGIAVQQVVGSAMVPGYRSTAATYAAAKILAAWPRANPLQAWWWRTTGALDRSRNLLWQAAKNDPAAIHATTIAFHNVVDALDRMRALAAANGPHGLPAEVVTQCLVAPATMLRNCVRDVTVPFLDAPLSAGTLIVFRAEHAHAGTGDDGLAFQVGEWNQCPAHSFVPALLAEVWRVAAPLWPVSTRTTASDPTVGAVEKTSFVSETISSAFNGGFALLNRVLPWYKLPTPLAVLNLLALRNVLRRRNLHDTEPPPATRSAPLAVSADALTSRSLDGRFTDLANPDMGCAGARFGRNMSRAHTFPDLGRLLHPNPRLISQRLLRRERFVPATTLNLLAGAWIQFQVHDWFLHKSSETEFENIALETDDPWFENPMRVRRSVPDVCPRDVPGQSPAYVNTQTHWWDGSQLYGGTPAGQALVRSGQDGKLRIGANGLLPVDTQTGIDVTGFSENWWIGLSLLHTLFTREHNAICDALRRDHPTWNDDRLFAVARLVNAALMAKIHTVEWTPAILAHPALQIGMNANWWGLAGERLTKLVGRISTSEAISGIPGSPTDHHAAPYALTEEFASVYRMHPLMPDDISFYALGDGRRLGSIGLTKASGRFARELVEQYSMGDLLYSFGVTHPGAVTLHNYPRVLQDLERPNGDRIDLAAVEIYRDRERGIPRYNEFRRQLHMKPVKSFEALTDNPRWAAELREVYGDVEAVDAMVGMFAETPPPGFGFSDTAFRVFILMASRRLKSDRFFTSDFTPAVYSQTGMDWVQNNDMRTVLLRHHPELGTTLHGLANAFAPWRPIS